MDLLTGLAVGVLFGAGIDLMVRRDVVKLVAGSLLISNSAILLLVSAGFGAPEPPLLPAGPPGRVADPVAQALALTAIVIGFGTTVLLLRIGVAVERSHRTVDLEELGRAELEEVAARGELEPRGDA